MPTRTLHPSISGVQPTSPYVGKSLTSSIVTLPVELVTKVIQMAWELPLTNVERTSLFRSFCLVSRVWLAIFINISLTDVHVTSTSFVERYLNLLRERYTAGGETDNDYGLIDASHTSNRLCRSISFRFECGQPKSKGGPSGEVISNLLYMVEALFYLPNLRKITLEYVDLPRGIEDIFEQYRLSAFPNQVTHLSIQSTYSKNSKVFARSIRGRPRELFPQWSTPSIRTLSVSGVSAAHISSLIETCPEVEVLKIDNPLTPIMSTPLPITVHTLELRGRSMVDTRNSRDPWGLVAAMEGGLFSTGISQRRVIAHLHTTEDAEYLKQECDRFGVLFSRYPL